MWAGEAKEPQIYYWGGAKVAVEPAADVVPDHACAISGLLEAQATATQYSYPQAPPGADATRSLVSANGTAAANLNCGNWNYQAVFSATNVFPYQYSFGNRGDKYRDVYGDAGGDVFWRDPNSFMIGAGVRRHIETEHLEGFGTWNGQNFDETWNIWTGTAFAELYPNEQFTLGLTGFFQGGDSLDGFNGIDYQLRSYGGSAYVRYYMTPNLRLSLRGFVSQSDNITSNVSSNNVNAVVSADYKIEDSPISVFGGVRYGGNNSNSGSSLVPNTYLQGFAGFRIAFGPNANSTLLERDRKGVNLH